MSSAKKTMCIESIESRSINWLWPNKVARNRISMIAGDPGLGKSQLTAFMTAVVTTGGFWPNSDAPCDQGNVILLACEDDPADTIRPRLEAAGANLSRVFIPKEFPTIAGLADMLAERENVGLVVIDPITAYLSGIDTHKTSDVRAVMARIHELASKHEAAIVLVSHLNKSGNGSAVTRVTGSGGFVAASRAAWLVAKDPHDKERRLFLPMKNNLGRDTAGLSFRIQGVTVSGVETSRIEWEQGVVELTADEVFAGSAANERVSAVGVAMQFLETILADGPVPVNQIKAEGKSMGISERTLERAKSTLNLIPRKDGMTGGWVWESPMVRTTSSEDRQGRQDCQSKNMAAFDEAGSLQCATVIDIEAVGATDDTIKTSLPEAFEQFYQSYPKKKDKPRALKAWMKINPCKELIENIMTNLQRQMHEGDKANFPDPAPWLNGRKWEI